MQILKTTIPGVLILEPKMFGDERGFFFESYNEKSFRDATGLQSAFVQDNHSRSAKNVLRGLHYQTEPRAQGKLIRVASGTVFDVAVDIRRNSDTYGKWIGATLSAENRRQLWLPAGMAHGFLTLSDSAEFLYKTTDYYSPQHERCIAWNDPDLAIAWPLESHPILSEKDRLGSSWSNLQPYSNGARDFIFSLQSQHKLPSRIDSIRTGLIPGRPDPAPLIPPPAENIATKALGRD
jgi:dTDP-4-dehydrorhamnose 3,5-epimerase